MLNDKRRKLEEDVLKPDSEICLLYKQGVEKLLVHA